MPSVEGMRENRLQRPVEGSRDNRLQGPSIGRGRSAGKRWKHCILHAKSLATLALRAPPNPEAGFRPLPSQVILAITRFVVSIKL